MLYGFGILVRKMSASIVKIDRYAGGSGTTPAKLMAYVTSGLGLALFYIYNAYLCIPTSIKRFLSSACGRCSHPVSEPR